MSAAPTCHLCGLPLGRNAQQREIGGQAHAFCCYGCCLAYQVHHGERDEPEAAALLIRLGVGGFLAMNIMLFSLLQYSGSLDGSEAWLGRRVDWLLWILATPLLLILGGPFFDGAWQAARRARMNADTLVSIGALAAYGYSALQVLRGSALVYFDTASMVLMLFTLGRYLEALGRVRAARSLAPILAAERAEVRVVRDGVETLQPLAAVHPGCLVRVLPGERIGVDGEVLEGHSECDEANLSGQLLPQAKVPGATVHAGSINGSGLLLLRATAAGSQTRWIRLARALHEALAHKSLLGDTIDRMAAWFIPLVLLLAGASAWYWSVRAGADAGLMAGLAVLVVACPCSLGLAAPLATALGLGRAAQRGILVRGSGVLERLAQLRGVAFDKTGTLTQGRLQLAGLAVDGAGEQAVRSRAAALAAASDHPLARAIAALDRGDEFTAMRAHKVRTRPGAGISGEIDGMEVSTEAALGSRAFMNTLGWTVPPALTEPPVPPGATRVYLGWAGRVYGCFAFCDTTLPEAGALVRTLRERGLSLLLLSGDDEGAVAPLAARIGIAHWRAQLMPEDKVRILRDWNAEQGMVAMVGDGLNDGPVLAAAPVGIAVGGASDLARESADVVLPADGLATLPWLLQAAREVRHSIRANLAWACAYNAVALTLAASGMLRPALAAALMAGSSLVVVARSLRAQHRADTAESATPAASHANAPAPWGIVR